MKAIYYNSKDRWTDYWRLVGEDCSELDNGSYPLYPAIKYLNRNGRILEAGCGLGRLAKWLDRNGFTVTAMELEEFSISKLKKDMPEMACVRADICKLPFQNESFSYIFLMGVIDVFTDNLKREFSVSEVERILQKDGMAFVSVPHSGSLFWLLYSLRRNGILRKLFGKAPIAQHIGQFAFSVSEVRTLIGRHFKNFTICYANCRMSYFYIFPFFRSRQVKDISFPELQRNERNLGDSVYKLSEFGEFLLPWFLKICKKIISPTLYIIIKK